MNPGTDWSSAACAKHSYLKLYIILTTYNMGWVVGRHRRMVLKPDLVELGLRQKYFALYWDGMRQFQSAFGLAHQRHPG